MKVQHQMRDNSQPDFYTESHNSNIWAASLDLGFENRNGKTVLSRNVHQGPLRVQKALYPEGPDVSHAVLLHPPGGIVGGDALAINVRTGEKAHALITTPGAGKWYRSGGKPAFQTVTLTLAKNSVLEWLPQEVIFFDGTAASLDITVRLGQGASYIACDTFCLGRVEAGETFDHGLIAMASRIETHEGLIWSDRFRLTGGNALLRSAPGMAGFAYASTFLAAGPGLDSGILDVCRALQDEKGIRSGFTFLPTGLLVGRCLGMDAEPVRRWFMHAWSVVRPVLVGREAVVPRVWNT